MTGRGRSGSLAPLFFIAACGASETTGVSSEPMTLGFEPASVTRTGARVTNGNFRCDVDMVIIAHGKSDHLVTLQSLTSTFSDVTGAPGTTINSSPVDWFGVVNLRKGETAVAHRQPTAPGPFTLTSALTYLDQFGTAKVTTFTLTCTE